MVGVFAHLISRAAPHLHHEHHHHHHQCSSDDGIEEQEPPPQQQQQHQQHQQHELHESVVAMEQFMPIDHPLEPPHCDQPVHSPAPEPCIIHDGRLWKERRRARGRSVNRPPPLQKRHTIPIMDDMLFSVSAPEKSLLKLLE